MKMPSTILHPEAFKRSLAADFDGVFDWSWTDGCFGKKNITPMDFDGVVERNGQFIVFETKDIGAPVKDGQFYTLKAAHATGCWTIMFIRGKSEPLHGYIWRPGIVVSKIESGERWEGIARAREIVNEWYLAADARSRF